MQTANPPMIRLSIDGVTVLAPPGTTILAAALSIQVHTPTLCHHQHLDCGANCRACTVELEGSRTLVPSCSRTVDQGMTVRTDSMRVRRSRRMLFELLLSEADLSAAPELQAYAEYYGASGDRFENAPSTVRQRTVIVDNPFFVREYAKCIACRRCTEACGPQIQHTFAIAMVGRGHEISVGAGAAGNDLPQSPCVFCGNCVGVCPTGALTGLAEYELRQQGVPLQQRLVWTPERGLSPA